jgi:hypothetical protein
MPPPAKPTPWDVTKDKLVQTKLMVTAIALSRRCTPNKAATHDAELHKQYDLAMDDPRLRLAVASGASLRQDEPRRRQAAELVQWCIKQWRDLPDDGSLLDGFLRNELRRGLAAVTAVVKLAADQGPPLGRNVQYVATAVAADAVAEVLQLLSRRPRDWQMTARVLEYYGWDLGTEPLPQKGDALRQLVRRRRTRSGV